MTLRITDDQITSDLVDDSAVYLPHAAANGQGAWVTPLRPGRLLDRNQAISAMTIAEERAKPEPDEALIMSLESEFPA